MIKVKRLIYLPYLQHLEQAKFFFHPSIEERGVIREISRSYSEGINTTDGITIPAGRMFMHVTRLESSIACKLALTTIDSQGQPVINVNLEVLPPKKNTTVWIATEKSMECDFKEEDFEKLMEEVLRRKPKAYCRFFLKKLDQTSDAHSSLSLL